MQRQKLQTPKFVKTKDSLFFLSTDEPNAGRFLKDFFSFQTLSQVYPAPCMCIWDTEPGFDSEVLAKILHISYNVLCTLPNRKKLQEERFAHHYPVRSPGKKLLSTIRIKEIFYSCSKVTATQMNWNCFSQEWNLSCWKSLPGSCLHITILITATWVQ